MLNFVKNWWVEILVSSFALYVGGHVFFAHQRIARHQEILSAAWSAAYSHKNDSGAQIWASLEKTDQTVRRRLYLRFEDGELAILESVRDTSSTEWKSWDRCDREIMNLVLTYMASLDPEAVKYAIALAKHNAF